MTRKKPWQTLRARLGRASGIALSYTMFLFVCLALLVIIGFTYDSRVRDSYWQQQRSHLTRVSSGMESQLQLMSDYSLQLRTDTTLLRLSNMHDETDANYVLAAYRMMQSLTIRQYGLISLPVIRSTLYLKESNHILTSSESVPAELYYRRTRSFRTSEYENWLAAMESAAAKPTFVDYGQFSGRSGELAVLMDISGAQLPSMPVVVAFELDGSALREYLLPENIADAAVYVLSADGTPLFSVGNAVALSPLTFDANQTAFQGEYRILRRVSPSGRQYLLQLPNSLANQATGQFLRIYLLIFLAALVVGALVIIQLIRRAMKPIRQLTTLPYLAAVNRAGQAVIVPSAKMVALVVLIHTQDFGVLLRHPRRTRARRRCQNDVDAAAPQPVDDFVQPRKVVHAVLRLQPRPRENRNRHTVHMCLMHQLDVLFQNFRMIQPLVRVIVAAVQENREARRQGRRVGCCHAMTSLHGRCWERRAPKAWGGKRGFPKKWFAGKLVRPKSRNAP